MNKTTKKYFEKYHIAVDDEIWDKLTELKFDKKTELPNKVVCFLKNGIIRKYHKIEDDINERDISLDFHFSGDIFIIDSANEMPFEVLKKGCLYYINQTQIDLLNLENKNCTVIQRLFFENSLKNEIKRKFQLLHKSPKELYELILEKQPQIIQNIPLKYIASYIGVEPETMSRIRSRIS